MKVGIITFIDYENYGNRLQNYALQYLLQNAGMDVTTILHERYLDYKYTSLEKRNLPNHWIKSVIWKMVSFFSHNVHNMRYIRRKNNIIKKRIKKNIRFSEKYIKESGFILREGGISEKSFADFDYLIAGSDQIWNPNISMCMDFYCLQYVPYDKRISFAASVGTENIPEFYKKQWITYIQEMRALSVREKQAAETIKAYTGREAEVHLDPTLLVPVEQWRAISSNSKIELPNKYIVTYILGDLEEDEEKKMLQLSKRMECSIVRLNDEKYPEYCVIGVEEFLHCIENAECVITDSFHACVFSVLFKKKFYVLQRRGLQSDMYSRLTNLLNIFQIKGREINTISDIKEIEEDIYNDDFVEKIINKERKKASNYFEKWLV